MFQLKWHVWEIAPSLLEVRLGKRGRERERKGEREVLCAQSIALLQEGFLLKTKYRRKAPLIHVGKGTDTVKRGVL